jgi:GH24 family phage-related lysozyme (muramidase)
MDIQAVTARLKHFEGSIPYLYRCTGGEVTVGIGHAILSTADALALNWTMGSPAVRPSDSIITTDYRVVEESPKGKPATYYQNLTSSRLTDAAISALLASDIPSYSAQLDRLVPGWTDYPENAQQALFDMVYNLGQGGLSKYHKLLEACAAGDWTTAAAESHRNGIPDERNEAIRQLFLECV